jgi:hypothetical protein
MKTKKKLIPIQEQVFENYEIVQNVDLPPRVLCRVTYPICNIDELNANHRRYGLPVWDKVMQTPELQEKLKNRCLFGHAEHPNESQNRLERTSHVVHEMWHDKDSNRVMQQLDILDTPYGRIVDTLLEAKCRVGVSTRAEGELEEAIDEEGNKFFKVLPESYNYITTDFTADPSTTNPYPEQIQRRVVESIEKDRADLDSDFAISILERCNIPTAKSLCESIKSGGKDLSERNIKEQEDEGEFDLDGEMAASGNGMAKEPDPAELEAESLPQETLETPDLSLNVEDLELPLPGPGGDLGAAESAGSVPSPVVDPRKADIHQIADRFGYLDWMTDGGNDTGSPYFQRLEKERLALLDELSYRWNQTMQENTCNKKVEFLSESTENVDPKFNQKVISFLENKWSAPFEQKIAEGILENKDSILIASKQTIQDYLSKVYQVNEADLIADTTDSFVEEMLELINDGDIDETEEIKKLYKNAGITPPKGKGVHTKKFHQMAVGILKGMKPKESVESVSEAKYEIIADAGKYHLAVMDGTKEIFRGPDASTKEEARTKGVSNIKSQNPGLARRVGIMEWTPSEEQKQIAYATAMKKLGKAKSVKKSHRKRSSESISNMIYENYMGLVDFLSGKTSFTKTTVPKKTEKKALDHRDERDIVAGRLEEKKLTESEIGELADTASDKEKAIRLIKELVGNGNKGIADKVGDTLVARGILSDEERGQAMLGESKSVIDTQISEASIRAERDKAVELVDQLSEQLAQLSDSKNIEVKLLLSKIKESTDSVKRKFTFLKQQVKETFGKLKIAHAKIENLTTELNKLKKDGKTADDKMVELESEYSTKLEQLESRFSAEKKKIFERFVKVVLADAYQFLPNRTRALLESAKSVEDLEQQLVSVRAVLRENALRSSSMTPEKLVVESITQVDSKSASINRGVSLACEGIFKK